MIKYQYGLYTIIPKEKLFKYGPKNGLMLIKDLLV